MDCSNLNALLEIPEDFTFFDKLFKFCEEHTGNDQRSTVHFEEGQIFSVSEETRINPEIISKVLQRLLSEWMRYIFYCQKNRRCFSGALFGNITIFLSECLHFFNTIHVDIAIESLYLMFRELIYYQDNMLSFTSSNTTNIYMNTFMRENLSQGMEYILHNMTALIFLIAKTQFYISETKIKIIQNLLFRILKQNFSTRNGSSLLHIAVGTFTEAETFLCKKALVNFNNRNEASHPMIHYPIGSTIPLLFPCNETTTLLLKCGADPNSTDVNGNTPLHIISMVSCKDSGKSLDYCLAIADILLTLIENGAHIDAKNLHGYQPIDLSETGIAEAILECKTPSKLSCICSRAISKYKDNYKTAFDIPKFMEHMIKIH
ncbi:unnamed protein product [Gordionus sp. m RMFG-2023]